MFKKSVLSLLMGGLFASFVASATLPTPTVTSMHNLNRIVAVVNESVITQSEFDHALVVSKQEALQNHIPIPDEKTFKQHVLDQLIYQKLQLQLAKRNNITATNKEIDEAIGRIATQNHITVDILKQKIAQEGVTFETFKKQLGRQIIITKLQRQALGSNVTVSKAEVAAFRAQHAAELRGNVQYDLATLLIPLPDSPTPEQVAQAKEKALAVYQQVKTQKNFDALMNQYPGSSDLGYRNLNDLPQLFAAQAVKMRVGEIAGPIQAPNGFHILKLLDTKQQGGGGPTNEQIQMIVYQQKFDKLLRPWLLKLKQSAYVKVYVEF
jgi:peptidyl-prolyl cis-trans isomerase SurA